MPGPTLIAVNGVELCVEEFGERSDPALLLIAGAESSMDWWDTAFCERLAAGGRRVIRYDLRDTGASTSYPPGQPGYTTLDLFDDVVQLLLALEAAPAHLVGISMGGGIAAQVAMLHPELVASLTVISFSPEGPGSEANGLPAMSVELAAAFSEPQEVVDWDDDEAVARNFIKAERLFSGTIPVDEARIRAIAGDVRRRSTSPLSAANHWQVAGEGEPRERLADITAPTLVIHGTEDPLFPLPHGEALAREIPGARFMAITGMGHQNPPPPTWDEIVPAILDHTRRAGSGGAVS